MSEHVDPYAHLFANSSVPAVPPEDPAATDPPVSPVDGGLLLDAVEGFLQRYVVYPGEAERVAHALWIGHCWFMDAWDSTPRIAFLSPEPGSGKSRALEVTEPLVPNPVHAVNATPAYLFRKVSDPEGRPTILFDEIDTIFGPRAKENEDLRGMLNAGHRKGAMAGRCVIRGKSVETEELPAYAAVALAGLDDLPDTIMTRSVVVRMRRRAPGETVEPWRLRTCGPEAYELRDRLAGWANAHQSKIAWPVMPVGVEDRNADVWEALLAVADLAGSQWPQRARQAAVTLVTQSQQQAPSIGVLLLRDLRTVFTEHDTDRLATTTIIDALNAMDESPWSQIRRGNPLDARGLSNRLGKYGIKPKSLRTSSGVVKGYDATELADAWTRYLSPVQPPESVTSVTSVTQLHNEQERNRVTDVTEQSPPRGDTCTICSEPLPASAISEGFTTHAGCEVAA